MQPRMKRFLLQMVLLLFPVGAFALNTENLLNDADAKALLEKKCIQTEISGMLPARFDAAAHYLSQSNLIHRIQDEYRKSISKDGTLDFPVIETGNGAYYYVNEKDQCTDLFELFRQQTSASTFDLIYHAMGKQYFGKYEVLIHIRAIDAEPAGTIYVAKIHAYPHNGPLRFFARRFGVVDRYFQRKTRLIAYVSTKICNGMDDTLPFTYRLPAPTWCGAR